MLKQFQALPTERRVREMKDRDYLWCLANEVLDGEQRLEELCPACRERALEERCPACGQQKPDNGREGTVNAAFDPARFEQLKEGSLR